MKATNPNYSEALTAEVTAVIDPYELTAELSHQEKPFDNSDAVTGQVDVTLKTPFEGDDISATIGAGDVKYATSAVHEDGALKADEGSVELAGDDAKNYVVAGVTGTGTITAIAAGDAAISATPLDGTYSSEPQDLLTAPASVAGSVGGTWTVTYSLEKDGAYGPDVPQREDAGSYTVYVRATNPNYTKALSTTATATISPAKLTAELEHQEKSFDGNADVLDEQVSVTLRTPFDGDDVSASIATGDVKYATSAVHEDEALSARAESVRLSGEDAKNYEVAGVSGTGTITPQTINRIKVQGPDPQMYDAADQTPGVVVTDKNGKVLEEGADYRITGYDNNYNVTTGDSPAIIHVEGIGNYRGNVDVEFEITPAPLTVTTPSAGKVYDGSSLTAGPADVEGLQGNDATAVTITATGTQTNVGNSVNGVSYDWGQVLASNYNITEDLGTLTVWPQSINPGDPDPDSPDPGDPDPTDPDPDFPGENPDPDNPVVPDQPFYTGAEVNAPQDVSYNGADQTWAPTVTDAEGNLLTAGEDYEVSYSTDDRTNVTGVITVTITGKGNYSGTITREYQITPLEIDVYIESQTKVEGEADPTFTFNYEGVLEGESMGWTGAFVRDAGEAAGTYNVAQGGFVLADNEAGNFLASNYTLTVHPGTLTITAAPVPPGPDGPDTPVTPVTPLPTPDPTPVPTPTPGDPGATETTTTPAIEEATETIDDDATPRTAPEPIDDDGTPLASGAHRDCWVHWLMLLGILVTVVYYGGVGVRRVRFSSSLQSFEDDVLGNDETNR